MDWDDKMAHHHDDARQFLNNFLLVGPNRRSVAGSVSILKARLNSILARTDGAVEVDRRGKKGKSEKEKLKDKIDFLTMRSMVFHCG